MRRWAVKPEPPGLQRTRLTVPARLKRLPTAVHQRADVHAPFLTSSIAHTKEPHLKVGLSDVFNRGSV